MSPTTPYAKQLQSITYIRFRLLQFRSPLLSQSFVYFLFVLLLRCFSSQAFLSTDYWFICEFKGVTLWGFPHSDICGSRLFVSSPQLFADLHVLLRLLIPRHSPLALCSFTFDSRFLNSSCRVYYRKLLRRYRYVRRVRLALRKSYTDSHRLPRFHWWFTFIFDNSISQYFLIIYAYIFYAVVNVQFFFQSFIQTLKAEQSENETC